MIVLPSARGRVEPVLFRFDARDCIDDVGIYARSFGQKVYGVFSRASAKRVGDQRGMLAAIPTGMPPLSREGGEQALIFEPAGSNLCTRSDDYSNAAWIKVRASVSAVPLLAAYFLAEDSTAANTHYMWATTAAFTADSHLTASVDVRPGARTKVRLAVSSNSGTNRFYVNVDLVARTVLSEISVGTGSVVSGSGRVIGPDADGFCRVSITGKIDPAATTGALEVSLLNDASSSVYDGDGSSGLYVRRAQVEAALTASSFSPTDGAASTRSADSLYFPLRVPPVALTLYVRGMERSARPWPASASMSQRLLQISGATDTGPRLLLFKPIGTNSYRTFFSNDGTAGVSSSVDVAPSYGDVIEARGVLSGAGGVRVAAAKNGGSEAAGAASAVLPLPSAWSGDRIHVGSIGSGGAGMFAFRQVVLAFDDQPLDVLREFAGV